MTCLVAVAVMTASVPGLAVAGGPSVSESSAVSGPGGEPSAVSGSVAGSDTSTAPATCRTGSADSASGTATADRSSDGTAPIPNESRDTTVALGDLGVVRLSVPVAANVTVRVASNSGYTARLRVGDDGDGTVRLVVNTYLAGNRSSVDPDAYAVSGNDTVSVLGGNASVPFEPGEYTVTVERNGSFVGEWFLTVTEPAVGSVSVKRAVPQLFAAENASVLRTAEDSDRVRPLRPGENAPEVVAGETVLIRIDAPSLLGVIAAQSGATPTERFLQLHEDAEPQATVTVDIFGPCGGINLPESAQIGGARVLLDHRNGSVYLLLDSDDVVGIPDGTQSLYLEGDEDTPVGAAVGEIEREFTVASAELVVDEAGQIPLSASENATVSGSTDLMAGSEVTVHLSSRVDSTFDRTVVTTVGPNGNFTATVDLSSVSTPNSFLVRVAGESFHGTVGEPLGIHWTLYGPGRDGAQYVGVDEFDLDGGFLVVYELNESGVYEAVGVLDGEDSSLEVADDENASRFFVVAHRDGNENDEFDGIETDPPYLVGGATGGQAHFLADWLASTVPYLDAPVNPPAFDPAEVSMPPWIQEDTGDSDEPATDTVTPTPTPTTTTATTTTPPPTDATPSGTEPSPTTRTTEESPGTQTTTGTPGFGAVVALTALLVAVLLGRRRGN